MARERDRYLPTLYLSRLGQEDLDGTWAHTAMPPLPKISESVPCLNGMGYTVQMEMVGEHFRVRLLPRRDKVRYDKQMAHILYSGANLQQVLATACLEVMMLADRNTRMQVSTRPVTRRVK